MHGLSVSAMEAADARAVSAKAPAAAMEPALAPSAPAAAMEPALAPSAKKTRAAMTPAPPPPASPAMTAAKCAVALGAPKSAIGVVAKSALAAGTAAKSQLRDTAQ